MELDRRDLLKASVSIAAIINTPLLHGAVQQQTTVADVTRTIKVTPASTSSGSYQLQTDFGDIASHPIVKALQPVSFLVNNLTDISVNSLGAELWISSEQGAYCESKILQSSVGQQSIYSAHRPIMPAKKSLLVTPFFSITQWAASRALITRKMLDGTVQTRFLLDRMAKAQSVDLKITSLVVNNTELVGSNHLLQMHARVRQAAEHDLAERLRVKVNAGATPDDVKMALNTFINKHQYTTTYIADNRRVYSVAKRTYAIVLLQLLERDPVSFLRSIKAATLQKRVDFTFVRSALGGSR